MRAAHPRSRGENFRTAGPAFTRSGSSPLTRGKPLGDPPQRGPPRLIPAHAGKTQTAGGPPCPSRAHPRSRGENALMMRSVLAIQGSSPLTRGKPCARVLSSVVPRLIPAHAGKTQTCRGSVTPLAAHPRSRGENHWMPHPIDPSRGSSPLTRGKPRQGRPRCARRRLIPAHAGKTLNHNREQAVEAAHPRSRGENPDMSSRFR